MKTIKPSQALWLLCATLLVVGCSGSSKNSDKDLAFSGIFPGIEQPPRVMITRIGFDGSVDASAYPLNASAVVEGVATQGERVVRTTDNDGLNDLQFSLDWDVVQDGKGGRLAWPAKNVLTSYMFDLKAAPASFPEAFSTAEIDVDLIVR